MRLNSIKSKAIIFLGIFVFSISFANNDNKRLPVYKITSPTTTIYLMGTTHVGKKDFYPLSDKILKALYASKKLILEVVLSEAKIQEFRNQLLKDVFYPENLSLETDLTAKTYQELAIFLKKFNLPIALVKRYKPFYLYSMIATMDLQNQGYVAYYGVESYLTRIARRQGILLGQLETAAFQFDLLKLMAKVDDAEEFVKFILAHFYESQKRTTKLFDFWRVGNFEKIKEYFKQEFVRVPKLQKIYQRLVDERDKNMALKLKNYLENENGQYFVAVGAAHILGILEVLKEAGAYEIIQLSE